MSRTAASERIGDLGITKALHLYGIANSAIDFGAQTFINGTPFTFGLRCWSTNPSTAYDGTLWSYGYNNGADLGYVFRANGTTRQLSFFYGSTQVVCSNTPIIGKQYIFVEFDGSTTLRVYIGTTLKDTLTIAPRAASSGVHTFLGQRDSTGRFWSGVIGDGCVYNRLLTAAEKSAVVLGANYPSSGAQLVIKGNENTGTTITDYSGNSRNGTIGAGSALWRNSPFNA